jgi:lipoprotein NlpD
MNRVVALSLSLVMLSACAQTQVSVRPTTSKETNKVGAKPAIKPSAADASPPIPASSKPAINNQESYIVETGDTLYGIAKRAGLSYLDVASWNNISEPFTVHAGQRIHLRPQEGSVPTPFEPVETKPVLVTSKPDASKLPVTSPVVSPVKPDVTSSKPVVDNKPVNAKPIDSKPVETKPVETKPIETKPIETKPVAANGPHWKWPTEGNLIARYVQGDSTQQGINIAGKSGQAVNAAADGTVVYSGAGLVGYGELIIIKHSSEWLSAYAHNRKRLVAEGAKVKAGDQIAEMGRTGVIRDMLHFEIRRNGKPVDPLLFLPKQ